MTVLENFSELYQDLCSLNVNDLERVYHEKVVFDDPVTTHVGLSNVKHYFLNLLQNTESCVFVIHDIGSLSNSACYDEHYNQRSGFDYTVFWTMTFVTKRLNKGNPINVDGTSFLKIEDNKIIRHKDYYDMGQMIYEHIPLLGKIVQKIKHRLIKQ